MSTGLVKVEIYCFLFATWPLGQCVMWYCGWGPLILSHHPAKFGVHRPCESGNITSLICHVTTWSMRLMTLRVGSPHVKVEMYLLLLAPWPQCGSVTWLCGWGPLNLSDHPAKFRVHRPYGTENNGVCNISSSSNSISNSNSNVEVLMPRFTNGPLFYWLLIKRNSRAKALTIMINIRTSEHCTEHWWSLKPLPIVTKTFLAF